jgi:hypothetical protein
VGVLRTPLGDVPVDEDLSARLIAGCRLLEDDPDAHAREHAVEVMLPFLLNRRSDVVVTPIVLAFSDWPSCRLLGETLAEVAASAGEPVLLLASSDMNHYEPASVGRRKDDMALDCARRLDAEALLETTRRNHITMCGRSGAAAALHAARLLGGEAGEIVDYSHSGMVTGDDGAVVGYAGVVAW